MADRLLDWYDRNRRDLPWRAPPGATADPYGVWLSEIMLQQTTVATVVPYYRGFLARWPTLRELAAADLDAVLRAWRGLGYYARARNLHRCAAEIAQRHGGRFPDTESGLRALPGIGAYTAAAIAAIAFQRPATVVDGNVERVIARLHGIETPLPAAKAALRELAAALTPAARPGDYAQAIMDLGATVCRPRKPACDACPWADPCQARKSGRAETLPNRAPRRPRPLRHGIAFWLRRTDGAVLMRRRPPRGLLGGMIELPGSAWRETPWPEADALAQAPLPGIAWRALAEPVAHGFTHFALEIALYAGAAGADAPAPDGAFWVAADEVDAQALPSLMRKAIRHARSGDDGGAGQ